jgi:hypothetical protein
LDVSTFNQPAIKAYGTQVCGGRRAGGGQRGRGQGRGPDQARAHARNTRGAQASPVPQQIVGGGDGATRQRAAVYQTKRLQVVYLTTHARAMHAPGSSCHRLQLQSYPACMQSGSSVRGGTPMHAHDVRVQLGNGRKGGHLAGSALVLLGKLAARGVLRGDQMARRAVFSNQFQALYTIDL